MSDLGQAHRLLLRGTCNSVSVRASFPRCCLQELGEPRIPHGPDHNTDASCEAEAAERSEDNLIVPTAGMEKIREFAALATEAGAGPWFLKLRMHQVYKRC